MNRAERRRNAKQEKPKTYVLTAEQIAKMEQDIARRMFYMMLAIPVIVLSDKFCFDEIQQNQFMHYALSWFDSLQKNEVTLMEMVEIAEKECGVRIIREED